MRNKNAQKNQRAHHGQKLGLKRKDHTIHFPVQENGKVQDSLIFKSINAAKRYMRIGS